MLKDIHFNFVRNKTGTTLLLSDWCSVLLLLQRGVSNLAAAKEDQKEYGKTKRTSSKEAEDQQEHKDEGEDKKKENLHAYLFFTQTILILSLHSGTGQIVSREVISRLLLAATAAAA